jgi:hypothetical protein
VRSAHLGKKKIGCKKIYQKQIFARGEELVKKKKKTKQLKALRLFCLTFLDLKKIQEDG